MWRFRFLWLRLARSYTTVPTLFQWGEAALLLAVFALVAVPGGWAGGLLSFSPSREAPGTLLAFAAVALVSPSLLEETLFRALLLPHPLEKRPGRWVAVQVIVAVSLFVLWHPLAGWLFVPWARFLFFDSTFLALCAGFGLVSSLAYLRTGSIWPSVVLHWGMLVVWKLWFGGWISAFGPSGEGPFGR